MKFNTIIAIFLVVMLAWLALMVYTAEGFIEYRHRAHIRREVKAQTA